MVFTIPDHILEQSGISPSEILLKVAILLFQEERLTLGQASKLADMHRIKFQMELSKRNIPIHYGSDDYQNDLKVIEKIL